MVPKNERGARRAGLINGMEEAGNLRFGIAFQDVRSVDEALIGLEGFQCGLKGLLVQVQTPFWGEGRIFEVGQAAMGMRAVQQVVEVGVGAQEGLAQNPLKGGIVSRWQFLPSFRVHQPLMPCIFIDLLGVE